jgi:NAD(P)H-dependent flavin oxidoreductase YrpB (nitropropane dioxygenase family)
VCELLGIEQPIVQAPMSDITGLAAAVSNAGALGMVTLTWSADAGAVVRETAALTSRPFGGNFVLTSDHHRDLDQALQRVGGRRPPPARAAASIEALSMWAGQSVALARQPQSAADIVTELTSRL